MQDIEYFRRVLLWVGVFNIASLVITIICLTAFVVSVITFEVWFTPIMVGSASLTYLLSRYADRLLIDSGFVDDYLQYAKEHQNDYDQSE